MFKLNNLCLGALLSVSAIQTISSMGFGRQPGSHDDEKITAALVAFACGATGGYMGNQIDKPKTGAAAGLGIAAFLCTAVFPNRSYYRQIAGGIGGAAAGILLSEYQKQAAAQALQNSPAQQNTKR